LKDKTMATCTIIWLRNEATCFFASSSVYRITESEKEQSSILWWS